MGKCIICGKTLKENQPTISVKEDHSKRCAKGQENHVHDNGRCNRKFIQEFCQLLRDDTRVYNEWSRAASEALRYHVETTGSYSF